MLNGIYAIILFNRTLFNGIFPSHKVKEFFDVFGWCFQSAQSHMPVTSEYVPDCATFKDMLLMRIFPKTMAKYFEFGPTCAHSLQDTDYRGFHQKCCRSVQCKCMLDDEMR